MFIPTTRKEMEALGWDRMDVILVTGDSYIDHPCIGVSVIGHVLLDAGYRVGIIGQPDTGTDADIARLGEPRLFWGVTAGSIDSMVANYTASGKRRKRDDYTPGGVNNRRPDRAAIVYTNLIRRFFKDTCPIVLGGIEASLRRIAHYDFWSDSIRRSILFDSKADILVYGMGEKAVLDLGRCLTSGEDYRGVRGICYIAKERNGAWIELPPYDAVTKDKKAFMEMFRQFCECCESPEAKALCQLQDTRYLVQNPPQPLPGPGELDEIHAKDYERDLHPFYREQGEVRALETIRFSITTHRGCFGGCNFCSIGVHQGRVVVSRTKESIIKEAKRLSRHPLFKGTIADVGGPTANMYALGCGTRNGRSACRERRCLFPSVCPNLKTDHGAQADLLKALREMPGVKRVFVASGIRHDLVAADAKSGRRYLEELVRHHTSGQMKIAPEHTQEHVLRLMGKSGKNLLIAFKDLFYEITRESAKKQFLTYYLMAAHPGCTLDDMRRLKRFATSELRTNPEQVQIFTPLPSTWSGVMYCTGLDPDSGEGIFVEKDRDARQQQKDILVAKEHIRAGRRKR
ncbi:MAG TPA: YgiQ family radical SAM protein [Deltaproteobacteria bacterium]|nr:YgiQ family radical SAM protein [Deltaproteobacteria bacterium]